MKNFNLLILFLALSYQSLSQLPARVPSSDAIKQLHCGHSLTAPLFSPWPGQYVDLVAETNSTYGWLIMDTMVGNATLPGAWLAGHWNDSRPPGQYSDGQTDPRYNIQDWELLVVTENFEGPADFDFNQSPTYLSNFVQHAWLNGNNGDGAPTMLWTNWPALDGTTYFPPFSVYGFPENATTYTAWRELLDFLEMEGVDNEGGWQGLQDSANTSLPEDAPPVYIIPGNRMMARLYDDIQLGIVPSITSVDQIFTDGVHTNDIGAYMVTLIHYACIFGKSPVGLSNELSSGIVINPDFATYAQNMIWEVVINYPRSGVVENLTVDVYEKDPMIISPNPATNFLNIATTETDLEVVIFDLNGKQLLTTNEKEINIQNLENGMYILFVNGKRNIFVKN